MAVCSAFPYASPLMYAYYAWLYVLCKNTVTILYLNVCTTHYIIWKPSQTWEYQEWSQWYPSGFLCYDSCLERLNMHMSRCRRCVMMRNCSCAYMDTCLCIYLHIHVQTCSYCVCSSLNHKQKQLCQLSPMSMPKRLVAKNTVWLLCVMSHFPGLQHVRKILYQMHLIREVQCQNAVSFFASQQLPRQTKSTNSDDYSHHNLGKRNDSLNVKYKYLIFRTCYWATWLFLRELQESQYSTAPSLHHLISKYWMLSIDLYPCETSHLTMQFQGRNMLTIEP